jgi:hypothetical protein
LIIFNTICNNNATGATCGFTDDGGGILCVSSSPKIINNIICNNEAENAGGGISLLEDSGAIVINNTIANNISSQSMGGGVYFATTQNFTTEFKNNIIWGNESALFGDQVIGYADPAALGISYCDLQDTLNSPNLTLNYSHIILTDPVFANPSSGAGIIYDGLSADWSLQQTSPCINAGTPDTSGLYLENPDIAGNARVMFGRIDIGAYESDVNIFNPLTPGAIGTDISIFPNPATDYLNLTVINNKRQHLLVRLTDVNGKILLSKTIESTQLFLNETINMTMYSAGIYQITILDETGEFISRSFTK